MKGTDEILKKELEALGEWMQDATPQCPEEGLNTLREHVFDFIKDDGEYLNVTVDIHIKNGETVTLTNKCWLSLLKQQYVGARIDIDENVVMIFYDSHRTTIPLQSISWIDAHYEAVDWEEEYNSIDKATVNIFNQNIEKWRKRSQKERNFKPCK